MRNEELRTLVSVILERQLLIVADNTGKCFLLLFGAFIVILKRLLTCMTCNLNDGLSLDICRSEFFPVEATAVLVTMYFHHLVNAVYIEPLLLIPNVSFRFFDGGQVGRTSFTKGFSVVNRQILFRPKIFCFQILQPNFTVRPAKFKILMQLFVANTFLKVILIPT